MIVRTYEGTQLRRIESDKDRKSDYSVCFESREDPEADLARRMPAWNIPRGMTEYRLVKPEPSLLHRENEWMVRLFR